MMFIKKVLLLISILSVFSTKAQEEKTTEKDTQTIKTPNPNRLKAIVLPSPFYTPDTKWGGGVAGLMTFNFPKDSLNARRSSVTVGINRVAFI